MPQFYDLDLIINAADPRLSGLLALGPNNEVTRGIIRVPQTVRGDQLNARIRLVTPSVSAQRQFDDVDLSAATVTVAIGIPDVPPTGGTFFLKVGNPLTIGTLGATRRYQIVTYVSGDDFANVGGTNVSGNIFIANYHPSQVGGTVTPTNWSHGSSLQEITTDLSYAATSNDVASAFSNTDAIKNAGGVTITSPNAGVFFVAFNNFGTQVLMVGNGSNLLPLSTIFIDRSQIGSSTAAEIQLIRILQNPYCIAQLGENFPPADYTVTNLQTGDSSNPSIQRLALTPAPYSGTFTFILGGTTFTAPFSINQNSMQTLIGAKANVLQSGQFQWDFTFTSNGSQSAITANVSGLGVPIGVTGQVLLNTVGLYQALNATSANSLFLTLEVKIQFANSLSQTKLQLPINVTRSIIDIEALRIAVLNLINVIYVPGLTALTGSSTALDHVPIASYATGSLLIAEITGSGQFWQIKSGPADVTDPGQIQTTDYDPITNDRHLARIA